jgi:hypothetical protein
MEPGPVGLGPETTNRRRRQILFSRMPGARHGERTSFFASRAPRANAAPNQHLQKFRGEFGGTSRQPTRYLSEGI